MYINSINLNKYNPVKLNKPGINNDIAFSAEKRMIRDNSMLFISARINSQDNINRIFGLKEEGIDSIFNEGIRFLRSQYKKEKMPEQERKTKLAKIKKNANELRNFWANLYNNKITWDFETQMAKYMFDTEKGVYTAVVPEPTPAHFADRKAETNQVDAIEAQEQAGLNAILLVEINDNADEFTKRKTFELLLNSSLALDTTLSRINDVSEKVEEKRVSGGIRISNVPGRQVPLSVVTDIVLEESCKQGLTPGFVTKEMVMGYPEVNLDEEGQKPAIKKN